MPTVCTVAWILGSRYPITTDRDFSVGAHKETGCFGDKGLIESFELSFECGCGLYATFLFPREAVMTAGNPTRLIPAFETPGPSGPRDMGSTVPIRTELDDSAGTAFGRFLRL